MSWVGADYKVAVLDVNEPAAQRVTEDLRADGVTALGVGVDVTDRAARRGCLRQGAQRTRPVTHSGDQRRHVRTFRRSSRSAPNPGRGWSMSTSPARFTAARWRCPTWWHAKWGRIVMISSSSAQRGSPLWPHYAASKGAVITLTKSLAREYAEHGITVNNIPPSGIETPMQHQSQAAGYLPSNEQMAGSIPLGYLGTGADIAAAVGFLCSEEAALHHRSNSGCQRRSGDVMTSKSPRRFTMARSGRSPRRGQLDRALSRTGHRAGLVQGLDIARVLRPGARGDLQTRLAQRRPRRGTAARRQLLHQRDRSGRHLGHPGQGQG